MRIRRVMDDQVFYDIVALELRGRFYKTGLWVRAIAETNDEGTEARALYIRLRASELMHEWERLRLLAKLEKSRRATDQQLQLFHRREKRKVMLKFLLVALCATFIYLLAYKWVMP